MVGTRKPGKGQNMEINDKHALVCEMYPNAKNHGSTSQISG
jgi:hypothetical protein